MKTCSGCHREQPTTEFGRATRATDGLQSWCRTCKREAAKKRYHANLDRERERSRIAARERERRNPGAAAAYTRAWRRQNPERARERDSARRDDPARKAWQADYWREWKARNPERVRLISRRGAQARRARLLSAYVEDVHPFELYRRHDGICGICGESVDPERFDVDHIVPLFAGGEHSYANTQPAHPICNYRKGHAMPAEIPDLQLKRLLRSMQLRLFNSEALAA